MNGRVCVYLLLPEATFSLWTQRCEFPAFLLKNKGELVHGEQVKHRQKRLQRCVMFFVEN